MKNSVTSQVLAFHTTFIFSGFFILIVFSHSFLFCIFDERQILFNVLKLLLNKSVFSLVKKHKFNTTTQRLKPFHRNYNV